MKLTKSWKPLLGIYLIIGGLVGLVLSFGSCTCKDANNWWIVVGLVLSFCVWILHQSTSQPEPKKRKKKKNAKEK